MLVKTVLQIQINTVKNVCQKLLGELLLMFSSGYCVLAKTVLQNGHNHCTLESLVPIQILGACLFVN